MNRNVLKILAVVSMLIDHIGAFLLPSCFWLRMVGRLAFPIFAFFVAEGLKHTKSRKKYVLTLFIFAVISQIPHVLLLGWYKLNILFTFLIAILIIYLLETYKNKEILKMISLLLIAGILLIVELFGVVDYGIFGVLLVIVFYFVKDKRLALCLGSGVLVLLSLKIMLFYGFTLGNSKQLLSLIAIPLILAYNGEKGNINLKYLFYVFYPAHLFVIYVIGLFV